MELWVAFLGGGAGAALVGIIGQLLVARQARKYQKEDEEAADIKALAAGMKWLLFDRIRHLGLRYLADGCVDIDEKRILGEMWDVYHHGLDGTGDLDDLMQAVRKLPIKKEVKA